MLCYNAFSCYAVIAMKLIMCCTYLDVILIQRYWLMLEGRNRQDKNENNFAGNNFGTERSISKLYLEAVLTNKKEKCMNLYVWSREVSSR